MKNIKLLFISVLLITFFSCQKENGEKMEVTEIRSNSILDLVQSSDKKSDAYVCLKFEEYFDSNNSDISSTFFGGFRDSGILIDAGDLHVNENQVIRKMSDHRYLSTYSIDKSQYCGNNHSINFTSSSNNFDDFNENIYVPQALKVNSSIGNGDYFYKDQDLVLNWESDQNLEKVHLIICSSGSPCIVKELRDEGQATISSSEFANFTEGNFVSVYLGRGQEICINQNEKQICFYSALLSRTSGHEVN